MNIVLGYPADHKHVALIQRHAPTSQVFLAGDSEVATAIQEADVFCGHAKVPVDWRAVVNGGRLRWIQSSAAGLDHCLTPEVIDSEVLVTGASGLFRHQVAEHAMALLFGLIRRLPVFFQAATARQFLRQPTDDLRGKTVGIVGFGGNGQQIARLLAPVGCRILATDRCVSQWQQSFELPKIHQLWPEEKLDDLLRESDIVILTLPLLDDTTGIISREALQRMPDGGYLINVGRGRLVDEAALIDALTSRRLSGAGLDVTQLEPLPPSSPLWELPNVIITPHVAAQSFDRNDRVTELFCENLDRFTGGRQLKNLVDKQLGFPPPENRL